MSNFHMGDVIDIYPYDGKIEKNGKTATFQLKRATCCLTKSAPAAAST